MTRVRKFGGKEKAKLIAEGKPFIVDPVEAAKITDALGLEPELVMAIIIVSGELDTSEVLRCEYKAQRGMALSGEEKRKHDAFMHLLQGPTESQWHAVNDWANRIARMVGKEPSLIWPVVPNG